MQITALSPHPCGLPRPSGNVSAILRPPIPVVSVSMVNKLKAGRTDRRPDKAQPPSGVEAAPYLCPCPAALLARAYRFSAMGGPSAIGSPDKAQRAAIRERARFIIGKLLNAVTCE